MDELQTKRGDALQTHSGIRFRSDETSPRHQQKLASVESQRHNYELTRALPDQRRYSTDCSAVVSARCSSAVSANNFARRTGSESQFTRKKNWVLESLGKAFSRKKTRTNSISEAELEAAEARTSFVVNRGVSPTQLIQGPGSFKRSFTLPSKLNPDHLDPDQRTSSAEDSDCLLSPFIIERDDMVLELQRQLDERDAKMREIRQEAMCSVSQLHELTAIVMDMKEELESLKAENDRLQRMVKLDTADTVLSSSSDTKAEGRGNPCVVASSSSSSRDNRRADYGTTAAASAAKHSSTAKTSLSAAAASVVTDNGLVGHSGSSFRAIKQDV